jgi:uncharacterized protein
LKSALARLGRVFVLSLEDNDPMPASVEAFAARKRISRGFCLFIGGVKHGSRIVSGPKNENVFPIDPIVSAIAGVHEIAGVGTLFPDEKGTPVLHMHAALGRKGRAVMGCIRPGVRAWKVGEVVLVELKNIKAFRKPDKKTGFKLLSL